MIDMVFFFGLLTTLLIIIISTFFFFSTNTIESLLSLIVIVIFLALLLLLLGSEFFAIIYILIYVGVIVVFFIFTLMIVNLRAEVNNREISNNSLVIICFCILNLCVEYCVLVDFSFLEELTKLPASTSKEFWFNELSLFFSIKTVGLYMFCKFGFLCFIVISILLIVLIGSLNIFSLLKQQNKKI